MKMGKNNITTAHDTSEAVTLRDAIHSLPDGEMCYIGAASAYIWIGKKEDAVEAMTKASTEAFNHIFEASIPNGIYNLTVQTRREASIAEDIFNTRRKAETETGELAILAEEELTRLNHALEASHKESERLLKYIGKLTRRAATWTEFCEREVRESYPHVIDAPFGTTILFSGAEAGKYWFYAEMCKQEAEKGARGNEIC
jgi:ABC-type proline/glycine betaine transport system ATPase subunit